MSAGSVPTGMGLPKRTVARPHPTYVAAVVIDYPDGVTIGGKSDGSIAGVKGTKIGAISHPQFCHFVIVLDITEIGDPYVTSVKENS